MARPELWRTSIDSYPFVHSTETRFADLDQLGHINNVAMAGLFEHGRGLFIHSIGLHNFAKEHRWLIVRVEINYLAESYFPEHVKIASGIYKVGNSSWEIASAAFQGGKCVSTCSTTTVMTNKDGASPISDALRAALERLQVTSL
jgi:acyl-CoA thioester hydrolase